MIKILDDCRKYYGEDFDTSDELPRKNVHRWDSEEE
jgi:hypothetical protein